jgi:phosphoglycerate dehydrogenase-like enzyme
MLDSRGKESGFVGGQVRNLLVRKARWAVLLCAVSLLGAADRKIVINATDARQRWAFSDEAVAEYRSAAGQGADIVLARSAAEMASETATADGVIGGLSRELFLNAKKLKWVQTFSAGVEAYRWPEFLKSDIVLTNCRIVQGPNIADHAFAMLLSMVRGLVQFAEDKKKESWNREGPELLELQDMTAVVIGMGGIGTQIAQRAHAFGMKVIGVDPKDLPQNVNVSRMVYPSQLDTVLPLADIVFVSAPLTPESRHMVSSKQFDLMKKGAFFIAVSRGGLYDTPALVKALDSRKLAGAGLDVTDPEPLPQGHPLWKFPNVVITPHIAGNSPGSFSRRRGVFTENIGRFVRNEPMRNVVDKQKGY